jgi:purine-binding chemotaxis protein CheW
MQQHPHTLTTVPDAALPLEWLSFRLGSEEYGVDILRVQEIRSYETPTHLANTPAFIKGVLNLRGVIVPVLDLRLRFGYFDPAYDGNTVTVILNFRGKVVGMVVDAVSDVVNLQPSQLQGVPRVGGAVDAEHLAGIATIDSEAGRRMLILLNIERLLANADLGLVSQTLQ